MELLLELLQGSSLIYVLWAAALAGLSFILIDRESYRRLFIHGFIGAFTVGIILFLASNVIKAWQQTQTFPFRFMGTSVFILVAWGATIIIFLWGLPKAKPTWTHYLYIGLFAGTAVGVDQTYHNLCLRPYAPWYRAWMWFFPMYFVFWLNYAVYRYRRRLEHRE